MPLTKNFDRLAGKMRRDIPLLRDLAHEDLVQECFVKALQHLPNYDSRLGSLSTWTGNLARNHLISMARRIGSRPKVNREDVERSSGVQGSTEPSYEPDLGHRLVLRSQTRELLGWLSDCPDGIERGWEVFNLLLKTNGNWSYTANALCVHTGRPWTTERVRNVVRAIKTTPSGYSLCESLGINPDAKEASYHGSN